MKRLDYETIRIRNGSFVAVPWSGQTKKDWIVFNEFIYR